MADRRSDGDSRLTEPALQRRPSRLLRLATGVSWLILVAAWCAEELVGERHWAACFLVYLPQHIFLPVPCLLWAVSRLAGDRRAARSNLLAALLVVFVFLGCQVDAPSLVAPRGQRLRVMTWNILGGRDPNAAWRVVERARPDLICLQEVNGGDRNPCFEFLRARLPEYHAVAESEFAVLSRYPVLTSSTRQLADPRRGHFLEATVEVGPSLIELAVVHFMTAADPGDARAGLAHLRRHLETTTATREGQVQAVEAIVAEAPLPLLVVGDFNTPPRGLFYRRLRRALRDSYAEAGWGFGPTYRRDRPVWRIDYVWHNEAVTARRSFVPPSAGSDHRPLVVDVVVSG